MSHYSNYIEQALAGEGGHLQIGLGGFSLHFGLSTLSGYDCETIKAEAIAAGLPVYDSRKVDCAAVAKLVCSGPMIAVGRSPDPKPWNALSFVPLYDVMESYRLAGAEVYHMPAPPAEADLTA